jgi:hypothetical protein
VGKSIGVLFKMKDNWRFWLAPIRRFYSEFLAVQVESNLGVEWTVFIYFCMLWLFCRFLLISMRFGFAGGQIMDFMLMVRADMSSV